MSELINNQTKRQEQLKTIIKQIHDGLPLEEARKEFKKHFDEVSTSEITQLEHALIEEGMEITEIQRLCDVHAAIFDGSISDIHNADSNSDLKGHPATVFKEENKIIQALINEEIRPHLSEDTNMSHLMLRVGLERLLEIEKHYSRKENLLFPAIEKRGITSPPKVMWGIDNEIRSELKQLIKELGKKDVVVSKHFASIQALLEKVQDMITKENNILLPMLQENLNLYDWINIYESSDEIGYVLDTPHPFWVVEKEAQDQKQPKKETNNSNVLFDAGSLTEEQVNAMLNTLPFDMTFVDNEGYVQYFTQGKERIFDRPKTILGRHVNMCHPPQSVDIVEEIVRRFKQNEADQEDFWISMGNKIVYIRYFAVRNKDGKFLGTLELTQNIAPIKKLTGEKRLLDIS